jgi:hypothetical protein
MGHLPVECFPSLPASWQRLRDIAEHRIADRERAALEAGSRRIGTVFRVQIAPVEGG